MTRAVLLFVALMLADMRAPELADTQRQISEFIHTFASDQVAERTFALAGPGAPEEGFFTLAQNSRTEF